MAYELPELNGFNCSNNNLTLLDVSAMPKLNTLTCNQNNLSSLDISNNSSLRSLDCSGNSLTTLILGSNNNSLQQLICSNNQLTSLNLSGVSLDYLTADNNSATIVPYSRVVDGRTEYFLYLNDMAKGRNESLSDMIHTIEGDDVASEVRFDISRAGN